MTAPLDWIQKNRVLVLASIAAGMFLAVTQTNFLAKFESVKAGPLELRLRSIATKSQGVAKADGEQLGSEKQILDTLELWLPSQDATRSDMIERAKKLATISNDPFKNNVRQFDTLRRHVVTPVTELSASLRARSVDLFDGSIATRLLVRDLIDLTSGSATAPPELAQGPSSAHTQKA